MKKIFTFLFVALSLFSLSDKKISEIETKVQQEGILHYSHPPKIIFVKREELRRILQKDLGKESVVLKSLGIIDNEDSYIQIKKELMLSNAVGFFDPENGDRIYLLQGLGELEQEFALVHELRHYIQFQTFPELFKVLKNSLFCEDSAITFTALLEGDANLLTLNYFGIKNFPMDFSLLKLPANKEGAFLKEIFSFIYGAGYRIIKKEYEKDGWSGVFKLLKNPPLYSSFFYSKPYSPPSCPCENPKVLGMKMYSFIFDDLAKGIQGDCFCLQRDFLEGRILFKSSDKVAIALKKISGKIKAIREERLIKFKVEVKDDSSYPGEKRNDPEDRRGTL